MSRIRSKVLMIGGFDPSAGAGVLADVKTAEQHGVYAMAVVTANTVQNDAEFNSVNWVADNLILAQVEVLIKKFDFQYVKFGLVPSLELMQKIIDLFREKKVKFIWDPILKASAGFSFKLDLDDFDIVSEKLYMITPNMLEINELIELGVVESTEDLATKCLVYLKGGHAKEARLIGKDYLYKNGKERFVLNDKSSRATDKHGTGCVLASSLICNLAKGYSLHKSCIKSKKYIANLLDSNPTLLGYHKR